LLRALSFLSSLLLSRTFTRLFGAAISSSALGFATSHSSISAYHRINEQQNIKVDNRFRKEFKTFKLYKLSNFSTAKVNA
jgi:hypothetical protein